MLTIGQQVPRPKCSQHPTIAPSTLQVKINSRVWCANGFTKAADI